MKRIAFLILTISLFATFAAAQKSVRKRTKPPLAERLQIQVSEDSKQNAVSSNSNRFDTPLRIVEKPRASYPSQTFETICVRGKVVLRVTFLSFGEIGAISVISGLGNGLEPNRRSTRQKGSDSSRQGVTVNLTP